jgi:hypothetical protein
LSGDSRDSDRNPVVDDAIQRSYSKKIFASILAESNATRSPSRALARVAESIGMASARAWRE